jgi:hypothetical protein
MFGTVLKRFVPQHFTITALGVLRSTKCYHLGIIEFFLLDWCRCMD